MIVRCENCQTEFALDDAQVGPEGVTVRCSVCAYVFKVKPAAGSTADQPWQIQTTEDLLFTAPDLETLKGWIVEGRLHPDDQVSRTGNHWLSLGEMPEFSSMFPGYKGLPKVFEAVDGKPHKPDAEASAVDALGPPPAFGSEASSSHLTAQASPLEDAATGEHIKPSSPLDAVTKHAVHPITSNTLDAAAAEARGGREGSSSGVSGGAWDDSSVGMRRKGGSNWMLWAALGVVSAVAIVFGVPQIRNAVMGGAEDAVEASGTPEDAVAEERPELAKAGEALLTLGVADVGRAEAAIQRAIDTGGVKESTLGQLKLAQADLLVSRSLVYAIAAALDESKHDLLIKRADDDLDRANRIFDNIGQAPSGERVSLVRARLRLAQGRDGVEILALLPESGAEEMRLAVEASALWRDPQAKVPSNLIGRLQGLEDPTALGLSVTALALTRSGDVEGAAGIADQLLSKAEDQPVGRAIKTPGQAGAEPEGDDTGDTGEATETDAGEQPGEVEAPDEAPVGVKKVGGGDGGGGGGGSFERLLERGCAQVESGKASDGVQTLLKAFDRKPKDLDVLVCLGKGYEKLNNNQRALHFYERALAQSPRHRSALRGAASVAAAIGSTATALKYYKRLLQVDPMNAKAKVYVDKHDGGGGGGGQGGGGQGDGGQGGAEPKKTDPPPEGGGEEQPPAG